MIWLTHDKYIPFLIASTSHFTTFACFTPVLEMEHARICKNSKTFKVLIRSVLNIVQMNTNFIIFIGEKYKMLLSKINDENNKIRSIYNTLMNTLVFWSYHIHLIFMHLSCDFGIVCILIFCPLKKASKIFAFLDFNKKGKIETFKATICQINGVCFLLYNEWWLLN